MRKTGKDPAPSWAGLGFENSGSSCRNWNSYPASTHMTGVTMRGCLYKPDLLHERDYSTWYDKTHVQ